MPRATFATFLIICPTSFFLGILFTNLSFDYHTLWTSLPPTPSLISAIESHYSLLSKSPPLIPRILNSTILVALAGFAWKLLLPSASESNYLFDGASLALFLIGFVMYGTNMLQGLKIVESGNYGEEVGQVESLKVMAATQTILALVLVGVLVLQAGQWYAEGKEAEEVRRFESEEREREGLKGSEGKKKA